jgi:hypothetical protein
MKKLIILATAAACWQRPRLREQTMQPNLRTRLASNGTQARRRRKAVRVQMPTSRTMRKGLSRNSEDCNKGCIDGNPP